MTQGLLKSFLFTVVGENWNLRGISYSMSYPFMCSLMIVVRSVHPRRPRGCESISSQGRRAPGDQQHWQATELHTLRRVKAHERTKSILHSDWVEKQRFSATSQKPERL